jgi:acyl-CoA reductase-like NAD-dependent aldehyde dehydrogenase
MKTQILSKTTLVLFSFMVLTVSAYSLDQRGRNRISTQDNTYMQCVEQVPGLTDEQVSKITSLNEAHRDEIVELRNERRSTIDVAEKNAIRAEMDELVKKHRDDVKALLTDEQKEAYEKLLANNQYGNRNYANNNKGSRRGNSRVGRGNGCYGRSNGSFTGRNGRRGNRSGGRW